MYLHQHVLVLGVFTVVRLPAQLLHLRHQAPVAHNLQQAGLKRDAQPGDTRGEEGLFESINAVNCRLISTSLLFRATYQLSVSSGGFSALLKGSSAVVAEEEEGVISPPSAATLSQLVRGFKVLTPR